MASSIAVHVTQDFSPIQRSPKESGKECSHDQNQFIAIKNDVITESKESSFFMVLSKKVNVVYCHKRAKVHMHPSHCVVQGATKEKVRLAT